ncbi:MAG: flavin monoamine oxidase family protein [Chitinophagales bacterium]
MCGILGVSIPLLPYCKTIEDNTPNFSGKVIIIGAGAAGMTAGHLLAQQNIEFEILEAKSTYGGRMKINNDFTDFPIPLGAEWLHTKFDVLKEITNNTDIELEMKEYNPNDSYGTWQNGVLSMDNLGESEDKKFINSSWLDFYEEYVLPMIEQKITYNTPVTSIDYTEDKIIVNTPNKQYTADKVILTAPLKMLQTGIIDFNPVFSNEKIDAINTAKVWEGIKVFIEFSDNFYPTFTEFTISPESDGQVAYYDAAYGQNTNKNILGLFAVGIPAQNYISLSDSDRIAYILNELDTMFSNQASTAYIKHTTQNWVDEPYIEGAYLTDHEDWKKVKKLGKSVADKIYFAGEAYTDGEDWGSVHTAALAAKRAVNEIIY